MTTLQLIFKYINVVCFFINLCLAILLAGQGKLALTLMHFLIAGFNYLAWRISERLENQ